VFEASDSSKADSTIRTMVGRFGRGSISHSADFIAKPWVRSWMTDCSLAVVLADDDQSAPPITPAEARLDSASAATLVPTIDFQVTAPRIGIVDRGAQHRGGRGLVGAGLDMHAQVRQGPRACTITSSRCEIGAPW
jgi:hypothetical protein